LNLLEKRKNRSDQFRLPTETPRRRNLGERSFAQVVPPQLGERPDNGMAGAGPAYASRMQLHSSCAAAVGRMAEHRQGGAVPVVCMVKCGNTA